MFDPAAPRVLAEPCGVDFAAALVDGLVTRLGDTPPETMARVTLIVNTARMRDRVVAALAQRGPGLLPRIHLLSELSTLAPDLGHAPAQSPLHLQLELTQLVRRLLLTRPGLAPPSAAFALAGTLCDLLGEMQEEGIGFDALRAIDTADLADHWQQSLVFLEIIEAWLRAEGPLTRERKSRDVLGALLAQWNATPPSDPVIIAGSTGSRAPTMALMRAVLRLPQGGVVLPGFDFATPPPVWNALIQSGRDGRAPMEDHPQHRLAEVCAAAGIAPQDVRQWSDHSPHAPERNQLISLALRPAPVTNQWRTEGPDLARTLPRATGGITLVLAQSPREEAGAIALGLRAAIAAGKRAALISPDRALTRQVTAALDRWRIEPDDSAGRPFGLSAPGRLMRQLAGMRGRVVTAEDLLIVLKHPQVATGGTVRGPHLLLTRDFEREVLRGKTPFPAAEHLDAWATHRADKNRDPQDIAALLPEWTRWVSRLIERLGTPVDAAPLGDHHAAHMALLDLAVRGPDGTSMGSFWERTDGEAALALTAELAGAAEAGGQMSHTDYAALFSSLCTGREVRNPQLPHPDVMILGTMEARMHSADLVILAGLNEGVWPAEPAPDPWLNRAMRARAGLRLPDKRIGLSAHDFQQAAAGREVWLSRAVRDTEAETVPSRWLNRLSNLTGGLGDPGQTALREMTQRGDTWLSMARALDRPEGRPVPAPRPAPAPPVATRPNRLSVTRIETLIRDPYAIYADKILRLRAQPPLRMTADARIRGTVIHDALRGFVEATRAGLPDDPLPLFTQVLDQALDRSTPWAAMRRLWRARLLSVAPWFLEQEAARRANATPAVIEKSGALCLGPSEFTLTAQADRIDIAMDGRAIILDYKTGSLPTKKQQNAFNKQLPLEALIVEGGGFADLGPREVAALRYIGFGAPGKEMDVDLTPDLLAETRAGLEQLIADYDNAHQGYAARRAVQDRTWAGDYDHLARFGEWDDTQLAVTLKVGR